LNEDLIEAAALAHDLGHPPFGHGGEAVLNDLMAERGGFEHNRQSLRVVDYLEHPYPRFRGLNLTRAVRECLARLTTRYDAPACEEFDPAEQAPLEGQLVDLADEIAYTSADLEDALAVGWIDAEQLKELALWRRAWEIARADAPDARWIHKRIRACKAVLAAMTDDALAATAANLARLDPGGGPRGVRAAPARCAAFGPETARAVEELQGFLLNRVYLDPRGAERDRQASRIIRELFAAFVRKPRRLPERYRRRIDADGLHRVVCDYIAGMTDRYAREQYMKLAEAREC